MILSSERLAADVTRVGPLIRVRPLVNQQVVALAELPVTELADELLARPAGSAGDAHIAAVEHAGKDVLRERSERQRAQHGRPGTERTQQTGGAKRTHQARVLGVLVAGCRTWVRRWFGCSGAACDYGTER